MTQVNIDYIEDKNGNKVAPITHVNAVRDSEGNTLPDILDRDYPTTSKTPSEGSTEVSLVTRGEKYNYDKVNNATDVSGASGIGADFKYLLLNGTTGEFEQALESYVNEKVRSAIGSLINNLDKGTGVKAVAGIDSNNDLGTITTANLASVLGVTSKMKGRIINNTSDWTDGVNILWDNSNCILSVSRGANVGFQIKADYTNKKLQWRVGWPAPGTVTTWKDV